MTERTVPSHDEVLSYLKDRSNWGRWGPDDEMGALNLITPAKRVAAARWFAAGGP